MLAAYKQKKEQADVDSFLLFFRSSGRKTLLQYIAWQHVGLSHHGGVHSHTTEQLVRHY
jgi:hypothetical protein